MAGMIEALEKVLAEAKPEHREAIKARWMRDVAQPAEIMRRYAWITVLNESKQNNRLPVEGPESYGGGKWMIYVPIRELNRTWNIIKQATIAGQLGHKSYVKTMKPTTGYERNPNKPICICTYDYTDRAERDRVFMEVLGLGIYRYAFRYKTDEDSKNGVLSIHGYRNISFDLYLPGEVVAGLVGPGGFRHPFY